MGRAAVVSAGAVSYAVDGTGLRLSAAHPDGASEVERTARDLLQSAGAASFLDPGGAAVRPVARPLATSVRHGLGAQRPRSRIDRGRWGRHGGKVELGPALPCVVRRLGVAG